MDEIFKEAIKQSPTLGLMFALVMVFLRHVKDMMDSHAKRTDEFISTVKEVRSEFITAVKEMKADDRAEKEEDRESRDRNSQALTNLGTEITRLSTIAEKHRDGA